MNKFRDIINKKIYICSFFSILAVCFSTLYYFIKNYNGINSGLWEFMYYMNGNYYNITFAYSTIVIFFFMYTYSYKEKYNYIIIRYSSVKLWIKEELKFIFSNISFFIMALIIIQILIGLSVFKLDNSWTNTLSLNEIFKTNSSPILINIYNFILLYMYLLIVAIVTFISCIKINNKLIVFFLSNSLGLLNILAYYTKNKVLMETSIFKNILMQQLSQKYTNVNLEFLKSTLYWCTIIILLIVIINSFILKAKDLYFKKENDSV